MGAPKAGQRQSKYLNDHIINILLLLYIYERHKKIP